MIYTDFRSNFVQGNKLYEREKDIETDSLAQEKEKQENIKGNAKYWECRVKDWEKLAHKWRLVVKEDEEEGGR